MECLQHRFIKKESIAFRFLNLMEGWLSRLFPVVTKSKSLSKHLQELGVPKERIFNIGDCVDTQLFQPTFPDDVLANELGLDLSCPRLLYVGLLESYQGVDHLLSAFKKVLAQHAKAVLIVIGFPNEEHYQRRCIELGIDASVLFLGRVNYFDLPRYLSLAPVTAAPKISETEGDGKIFNYMAMGVRTIAFERPVSREILGETGIFANFKDVDDFARKIVWAFQHLENVADLGLRARQRVVAQFSCEVMGKKLESVYRAVLKGRIETSLQVVEQI